MVVPAYNEALKLHASLTEILDYLRGLCDRYRFEVIVVDDGSTDGTGAIADEFAAANVGVRVLHHAVNFRLGQALRFAFGQSHGDYVVVFDSDLSYSVDHIGRMLEAIEQRARPHRRRQPLHEGRPDQRDPVATRGHEQGREPVAGGHVAGRRSTP